MPPISFDAIPASWRLPGVYIEFSNALAGAADISYKVLVIGQRLAAGTVAAGQLQRVTNAAQAEEYWGRGSMLAEQFALIKAANQYMETWGVALDENAAGVAATGKITSTGAATEAGTLALYIAGKVVQVAVASGDTQAQVATAIVAAIAANTTLPVTAVVDGAITNQVNLTARWKGETGNDIDLRLNYYGEKTPKGVAIAFTALAGGTANPDISVAIAAMGAEWWNWIVMPFADTANLVALEAELDGRWGPLRQIGARAFAAYRGSHAATGTWGNGRNSPHVSPMGTNLAPQPPYLWAAVNAVMGGDALARDPARPLRSIRLPGLLAPAPELRWTDSERNLLLFDGISTYTVGPDGSVAIERQITMYQLNSAGISDTSYLSINTPETLERIRARQRALFAQKYPRHKLAQDADPIGPGQPVMTPQLAKAELLNLYAEMIALGWVQDYEGYKASLMIEADTVNSRLNVIDSPKLVGQYEIHAQQVQFRR